MPKLFEARERGTREYAAFAGAFLRGFDVKWLEPGGSPRSPIGSNDNDIQALADLASSFNVAADMRVTVVSIKTLTRILVVALLPAIALVLSTLPAADIAKRIFGKLL